jgi:hypothetical protein
MNCNGCATVVFHDKKLQDSRRNDYLEQEVIFITAY